MTDEQRKQVDDYIEAAWGDEDRAAGLNGMDDPQFLPLLISSTAASNLAIAIMLRDMLDKPQEPMKLKRVSYGWRCRGCNKLTPNSVPACWHCCPREWQTPVWREEFGEVIETPK